jgi:glycosyltransferase involved in cell wall biosynthesis
MSNCDPLVSVVISTYNREAYLREAISSVYAQTHTNWELIIADDSSMNGTREYLASLSDERVRVIQLKHSGSPALTRNSALAHAAGQCIAFLDDDDLWKPEKLSVQIADLMEHPERRWSYTNCDRVNQDGRAVGLPAGYHFSVLRLYYRLHLPINAAFFG